MAAESSKCCCLCRHDLHSVKGLKKHKRYNGASCTVEREVLDDNIRNCGVDLGLVQKNFEENAIICYECSLKLTKIKKLESELARLKMNVHGYLSNIQQQQQPQSLIYSLRCTQTHADSQSTESDSGCPPNKVVRRDMSAASGDSPKCEVRSEINKAICILLHVHFSIRCTVCCEL